MRKRNYFGIWLLLTLVMALGIGAVAAIRLSDSTDSDSSGDTQTQQSMESQAEAGGDGSEGELSSYLSNQRKHDIDMDYLGELVGDYQAAPPEMQPSDIDETYWHLSILKEYEGKGPYLTVYDNEAGNPGFEGRIMYLQDNKADEKTESKVIIVEIDPEYFDAMPADWSPEGDGKYAVLDILRTGKGVKLGYRGSDMLFAEETEN